MATCIDPNCTTHLRGEIVPVAVEIKCNEESTFTVVPEAKKTYCEVRSSSGEVITRLIPRVEIVSDTDKKLYCSWDTSALEVGYYILRFWIGISLTGAVNESGEMFQDYRLSSDELKRYIKSEG